MAIAVSITILSLAAGVHLLMYAKRFGFGKLYMGLAWFVIVLSLSFNLCCTVRGAIHHQQLKNTKEQNNENETSHDDDDAAPVFCRF